MKVTKKKASKHNQFGGPHFYHQHNLGTTRLDNIPDITLIAPILP